MDVAMTNDACNRRDVYRDQASSNKGTEEHQSHICFILFHPCSTMECPLFFNGIHHYFPRASTPGNA